MSIHKLVRGKLALKLLLFQKKMESGYDIFNCCRNETRHYESLENGDVKLGGWFTVILNKPQNLRNLFKNSRTINSCYLEPIKPTRLNNVLRT